MSKDFVVRLDDKLRAKRESFDQIPVVDISQLLDGSNKQNVAKEIGWALSNAGFMYVKNHGIPQDLVDSVFDMSRRFFDLPMSEKMTLHV
ncbi:2-oxoglutarate and iron-dependent oxygenase domain-containing protein, partial [Mesorhizobium sp.]